MGKQLRGELVLNGGRFMCNSASGWLPELEYFTDDWSDGHETVVEVKAEGQHAIGCLDRQEG